MEHKLCFLMKKVKKSEEIGIKLFFMYEKVSISVVFG
jgi:hypothetical protein